MSEADFIANAKIEESSDNERTEIREELKTMSFEDLMKLKEELGSKVYNEAIFGTNATKRKKIRKDDFKRDNKNRPREMSSKRPVPLLGLQKAIAADTQVQFKDPRFDSKCGEYNSKKFRENYEFINEIKDREIEELKKLLEQTNDKEERKRVKFALQRLENQKHEESRRKKKEELLNEEKEQVKELQEKGRKPFYLKKKERRAKELVQQFEELKNAGKLARHLERRRKKNATKDRKKKIF